MKNKNIAGMLLVGLLLFTLAACTPDEEPMAIPPTSENAKFSYTVNPDNPNEIIFTGQPDVETWYTHWDFGDFTSAEGLEPTKVYFLAGEYEVRFKIFTEGGTAESVQTITIENDIVGDNLVLNGDLEGGDASWNILAISPGVSVAFENGTAIWTGGGWGHEGIYQQIDFEANVTYQINMDLSGSGMTDCWFEVYVGQVEPMDGVDYTDGGIRLGLNTWEGCGGEPFQGPFTSLSCTGGDGTFEFSSPVSAYLVIRGGGVDYGVDGITVDNISILGL